ncbi:MAG: PAS domain-containing protein, partial [Rhodocyclaceae bacterium]
RQLLQEAVSSVAQGFTIYDAADRLVLCNEAYLNLYDMSGDAIVPGTTFEEILRQGVKRGQYKDEAAIADPEAWVRQRIAQHRAADGEVIEQNLGDGRWLLAVEYRTASGHIVGNRTDITKLKQTEASLRERTEQLNVVFDLSPDGFVSFDAGHRVRYVSPAFARLTHLKLEDVIGLEETAFSRLLAAQCLPGAAFRGVAALRESMRAPLPGVTAPRELFELTTPGARVLEAGLRESQAANVSQILYVRDVTREMEVDRMKSEFLSTAAHELRTPMASIYGFSELLMSESFDAATQRDLIETIHRNADLMASIINELLDLARIEARRGKDFVFEAVQAQALVQQIVANFKAPAGRDAPLLDLPGRPLWLRADPKKMEQALANVLSNAYKYSPEGGAVRVTLELRDDGAGAIEIGLRITDRGIGMKPEQLARVCERFYRADTSGKIPGTGLGMSIVGEILNLHRGRVEISSVPGAGTEVTLWLAADAAPAQAA